MTKRYFRVLRVGKRKLETVWDEDFTNIIEALTVATGIEGSIVAAYVIRHDGSTDWLLDVDHEGDLI